MRFFRADQLGKYVNILCLTVTVLLLFLPMAARCQLLIPGTEFAATRPGNGNTLAGRIYRGDVVV